MEQYLSREQLIDAANELALQVLPKDQYEQLNERTIRYWTGEGLIPRSGGPRKAARYAPEIVFLCVFIRRLQKLELLSLDQISGVIAQLDSETIQHIVETNEPIETTTAVSEAELKNRAKKGETMISICPAPQRSNRGSSGPRAKFSDKPTQLDAISDLNKAEAIESVFEEFGVSGCEVEIQNINYDRIMGTRGSFREPARLELLVRLDGLVKEADRFQDFRAIPDLSLCESVAENLTELTGEPLAVELATKSYPRKERTNREPELRIVFLIARHVL